MSFEHRRRLELAVATARLGAALRKDMAEAKPLYVSRALLNGAEVRQWAAKAGIDGLLDASDMHVTVTYSKRPVDWFAMGEAYDYEKELVVRPGGARAVERFGDAVVLRFLCEAIQWRHDRMVEAGASYDFPEYKPHVTLGYDASFDVSTIDVPYEGELRFGPERFRDIDPEGYKPKVAD